MSIIQDVFPSTGFAPLVGVVCDRFMIEGGPYIATEERYVAAVREGSGVVPLLIPLSLIHI